MGGMIPAEQRAETPEHRVVEFALAKRLEAAWACTLRKNAGDAAVDFTAIRAGAPVAVIELKSRQLSVQRPTYRSIWVAESKRLALLEASERLASGLMGAAFFVCHAALDDYLYYVRADELEQYDLQTVERRLARPTKLSLDTDREPCRLVPIGAWRRIYEGMRKG